MLTILPIEVGSVNGCVDCRAWAEELKTDVDPGLEARLRPPGLPEQKLDTF